MQQIGSHVPLPFPTFPVSDDPLVTDECGGRLQLWRGEEGGEEGRGRFVVVGGCEVGGLRFYIITLKRCLSAQRGQRRNRLQKATAAFFGPSRALTRWS